ncbi:retrovirus-related pol polyprotein from transposon TNT 1-94 [Tanacetum coccineum]
MDVGKTKCLAYCVETLRKIVEEAKVERPLDSSLAFACLYTKHYQELLEYVNGTCPKDFNQRDKNHTATPLTRKKQVTFEDQCETSNSNTYKCVEQLYIQKTNVPVPPRVVITYLQSVNASPSVKNVVCKVKPTGRIFTLGEQCPLTSLTKPKVMLATQTKNVSTSKSMINNKLSHIAQKPVTRYQRRNQQYQAVLVRLPTSPKNQAIAHANQREPNQNWGFNFPNSPSLSVFKCRNFMKKFIGTVRFGNDHFGAIIGYGDYVIGDSVIYRVYYVEGLGHNMFSVRQFCDSNLEVAFRKHSCYICDTDGVELIKGSHGSNLYSIFVEDMMKSSPICLLSKASKNKSGLWHRHLNHLNFGTINDFARKDLVRGLPRLKFKKDHLCSACQLGKSKKHTHTPKAENTILEVLNTLHMDLCRPMRVQTINGKKYILVIVYDYSRFTWVKFLRSKDETPEFVIKFLMQIQVGLNKTIRYIRADNGIEFVNKDLIAYYESVDIFHQKAVPRTP